MNSMLTKKKRKKTVKVHLTPTFFLAKSNLLIIQSIWAKKIFEFAWVLDFLCPFKVGLEVLYNRVLGSLGRRLLMTSTLEPNTMALCICSRKWNTKLIFPIYFGTKMSKFCFGIISLSSLESELSFNSKEHVQQLWTYCLQLWEQFAIFRCDDGEDLCRQAACIWGMER